jgi:hypothetical protein
VALGWQGSGLKKGGKMAVKSWLRTLFFGSSPEVYGTFSHEVLRRMLLVGLADPWEELRMLLPLAKLLNVDETGHKENGRHLYTWCFRARKYILFKIAETRGTAELLEMLGADFQGIIGCDYFKSYQCYMQTFGGVLQFCLAHLIREVKFLLELPDKETRFYGECLLSGLRGLFQIIHERWRYTAAEFKRCLEAQRRQILWIAGWAPSNRYAQNLAARLKVHGASYFRFITTPGLEPTNNTAEQAISPHFSPIK